MGLVVMGIEVIYGVGGYRVSTEGIKRGLPL